MLKDYVIQPGSANHIICMSTNISGNRAQLYTLCGINMLPFQPIDIDNELCVYQNGQDIVFPTVIQIEPDEDVRKLHKSFIKDNMILQPQNVHLKDRLLMSCTGDAVDIGTTTIIGDDIHVINVCKHSNYFNPSVDGCMICLRMIKTYKGGVLLTCGHVLCTSCVYQITTMNSEYTCPMCRQPFADCELYRPVIDLDRDRHRTTVVMRSKLRSAQLHISKFLQQRNVGDVLCVVLSSRNIAEHLSSCIMSSFSYGFDESVQMYNGSEIVFCRLGSYDRYMESICTSVLIVDIYGQSNDVGTVLHSKHDVTLMLMKDCLDSIVFKHWCIKWSV